MTTNAPPSRSVASDDSLNGTFREAFLKTAQRTNDMLPAEIVSYDRVANRAVVKLLIRVVKTDNTTEQRGTLFDVPVFQFGSGGFAITFNLLPGSKGWLKANDRNIGAFLENLEESAPPNFRTHSFEDAVFFPDVINGAVTSQGNDTNDIMSIQNPSGSVKIAFRSDGIRIVGNVTFQGDVTINGIDFSTHVHTEQGDNNQTSGPEAPLNPEPT